MKNLLLFAFVAALIVPAFAAARDARPGFGAWVQGPGGQQMRKGSGEPPRGEHNKRAEHEKGDKGRLTEEERRELHRDLERANREIYRRK